MEDGFGMDGERLRRYKNLQRTTQNLRDYMSDLELVLTSLAETAAVSLHRDRASQGIEELFDDATEAGRIAGAGADRAGRRLRNRGEWMNTPRPTGVINVCFWEGRLGRLKTTFPLGMGWIPCRLTWRF